MLHIKKIHQIYCFLILMKISSVNIWLKLLSTTYWSLVVSIWDISLFTIRNRSITDIFCFLISLSLIKSLIQRNNHPPPSFWLYCVVLDLKPKKNINNKIFQASLNKWASWNLFKSSKIKWKPKNTTLSEQFQNINIPHCRNSSKIKKYHTVETVPK